MKTSGKTTLFLAYLILALLIYPSIDLKASTLKTTIWAKLNQEYRSNINRMPDSTKLSDFRTNFYFIGNFQRRVLEMGTGRFSYELRYHGYKIHHNFDRNDHILRAFLRYPILQKATLHASNELHFRFYPIRSIYNYRRNIFDMYISAPLSAARNISVGYYNWIKSYPKSSNYQTYLSHRFYLRTTNHFSPTTILSGKFEIQHHRGNLYPGSTVSDQKLNLSGYRYVLNIVLDKIFTRNFLTSLSYRIENDRPSQVNFNEIGEHIGDENSEELLTEDADFGYFKNQLSLSTLSRLNPSISFMTFYLIQFKKFSYWRISTNGPNRADHLLFLSNILKLKVYRQFGMEIRYNFEVNFSNISKYSYKMHVITAGIFLKK